MTCPDNDGDGYTAARCGGDDCDDADEFVNPGARELCGDALNNDCKNGTDCEDPICRRPEHCQECPAPCDMSQCPTTCLGGADVCRYQTNNGCQPRALRSGNCCYQPTPVVVDVGGDGFDLTGGAGGVDFDFDSDGTRERASWTKAGSDDAWLALDRDGNGRVDHGRELFGGSTPQPQPPAGAERNGFLALAEYDRPAQGGNGDGVIDGGDAVFDGLRLWQDVNHDGLSEPHELQALAPLGVARLHLDYKESKRVDEHGNRFKYRAKVDDAKGSRVNRWAWDVFLVAGQ